MSSVSSVPDAKAAAHLLDPMRAQILALAREPMSASQVAEKLGLPRQRVNYHVRKLAAAKLLREAGRRERRNLTEVLYVAATPHFLVDPAALGGLAPDPAAIADKGSGDHLLALAARTQSEVRRASAEADEGGRKLAVIALDMEVKLAGAAERDAFAKALQEAVAAVAARFGSPRGQAHRLVAGCYPEPRGER